MITDDHKAGYRIDKIYVADQSYRIVDDQERSEAAASGDRQMSFDWDWWPVSQFQFEVALSLRANPTQETPEQFSVRVIGLFTAEGDHTNVVFEEFLRVNAPAILFPFAREVISTMTGRGPFGAFHLNPINVPALLSGLDLNASSGHRFLAENPSIAENFGLPLQLTRPSLP